MQKCYHFFPFLFSPSDQIQKLRFVQMSDLSIDPCIIYLPNPILESLNYNKWVVINIWSRTNTFKGDVKVIKSIWHNLLPFCHIAYENALQRCSFTISRSQVKFTETSSLKKCKGSDTYKSSNSNPCKAERAITNRLCIQQYQ